MNKRIRINGKLYEAVAPRNRSRRVRSMNESYGKKISAKDAYYKYDVTADEMPWGPNIAQSIGNCDVFVIGNSETTYPEVYPMIYITKYTDDDDIDSFAFSDDYAYSNDQNGYDRAADDFQDICRALDNGDSLVKVARRFHLEVSRG